MTASGNRPRSAKKAKTSSQTILYMLDTQIHSSTLATRVHVQELQYRKPASGQRGRGGGPGGRGGGGGGGRVIEVK